MLAGWESVRGRKDPMAGRKSIGPDAAAGHVDRAAARAHCRLLAERHYENFPVVSRLLPAHLRQHFCNIYAYSRTADDLADESGTPRQAQTLLEDWRRRLRLCYSGYPDHPVFVALAETIEAFDIPPEPFEALIEAFVQDQWKTSYDTWEDLIAYCRNSANPVGHLVLYLFGYRDQERMRLSDRTCTALQLVNFWQDVSRDLDKGRVYVPLAEMNKHGYEPMDLAQRRFSPEFRLLMSDLCARTARIFEEGKSLVPLLRGRARIYVGVFSLCGAKLLRRIERENYNVFLKRPVLTRLDKLTALWTAIFREGFRG
jgi:squalene synthase HpnC